MGQSGLTVGTPYQITDIDMGELCYSVADENGECVNLAGGGFSLLRKISGKTLYVGRVLENAFYVKEEPEGEELPISSYNGSVPTTPIAVFTEKRNVVAEWCTPVFDLGTAEYAKSLRRMTVVMSPASGGRVRFGYETRNVSRLFHAKGIGGFSFENLSFEDFTFDTGFTGSYTVLCNERNFNYIMFRFLSDSDCNCAVEAFTVTYVVTIKNRGVR